MEGRKDLRNIAIIAHVDHGKTTLVDEMLDQSGTFAGERGEGHVDRVMDSGDIERERGITILAKNTSIQLPGVKLNIVDTPGHMDFGGEVERTLQMVEGFLLLVDAAEGPLPGTRFVLKKALSLGLKPMVLINKIDRKDADIERVEEEIHDLFLDLAECDSHLDFPVLYGSSKLGFVSECPAATSGTMQPLFDAIIKEVPAPKSLEENLQILITNLDYSDYVGRIGIGRVFSSEMRSGDSIVCCKGDNVSRPMKSAKLYQFEGLKRVEVDHVQFGDIVAVAGLEDEVSIGTTLCSQDAPHPIAYVDIDEPTLSMNVGVNTSPFAGREGDKLTSRQIFDRLQRELRTNVALRVETIENSEYFKVSGRGQLHLGVLVETMRREGFEMQISAPRVIFKDVGGKKCEPFELATVNIDAEHQGIVIEKLSIRRGVMQHMEPDSHGRLVLEFKIPSRGLLGFRGQFLTDTRGTGTINSTLIGYEPHIGDVPARTRGSMVSMEKGSVTAYALDTLQTRGVMFVKPCDEVYEGMVIGENSRDNDMDVNPVKGKKLTNMRSSGADDAAKITPPKIMTLEESFDWINDDELIEVSPKSVRLRKVYLKAVDRKRNK